jgi:hypothetical protein
MDGALQAVSAVLASEMITFVARRVICLDSIQQVTLFACFLRKSAIILDLREEMHNQNLIAQTHDCWRKLP